MGQPSQQMGGSLGPLQIPTVSSFSQSAPGQAGSQGPGLFGTAAPAHNTTGFGGGGGTTLGGGLFGASGAAAPSLNAFVRNPDPLS